MKKKHYEETHCPQTEVKFQNSLGTQMPTNQRKWENNYFWGKGNHSTIFKRLKNNYIQNLHGDKNKPSKQKIIEKKMEAKEGKYKTNLIRSRIY